MNIKKKKTRMEIFEFDTDKSFDYENGFYLTGDISRIGKLLAQYEIYKRIVNLPGEVLEFGVFKGVSLIRLVTFRNLLENTISRKIIGFDVFGSFPKSDNQNDNKYAYKHDRIAGQGIPKDQLQKSLHYKSFDNVELVEGNILETLPEYLGKNPHLKVALVHLDTDVYEPAKLILSLIWEKMVKGGHIMLDDYPTVEGEVKAVDEFIEDKDLVVKKLPIAHIPSFIVKK